MKNEINNMKPGQSLKLGGNEKVWTTVERSGDGKTLRFVRHTANGFEVFKKCNF
jgi:hypothetical protein